MKNLSIVLLVTAFVLLFSSCGDIIDADKNRQVSEITIGKIKEDQEIGVIMPLKDGNVWYYKVTEYNNLGSAIRIYTDSIRVFKEKSINDEKWFEVYFPMISEKNVLYMTNSDRGLHAICRNCPEYDGTKLLLAKYPEINNTYYSGFYVDTLNTNSTFIDSSTIMFQSANQSVTVPKGSYDCVKYTGYFESQKAALNSKPYLNAYFTPNFGLVKAETYPHGNTYIRKIYELIDGPSADQSNECIHSEKLNLGLIHLDSTITISRQIKNNSLYEYRLNAIMYSDTTTIKFGNFSPSDWINNSLKPEQTLSLDIFITPKELGKYSSYLKILYSDLYKCWFNIEIEGTCIK